MSEAGDIPKPNRDWLHLLLLLLLLPLLLLLLSVSYHCVTGSE